MNQYTYKDIELFLLDDDLFQWAKYGTVVNGFDLQSYKLKYPGYEAKIDFAITVIRSVSVTEDSQKTSDAYKRDCFNAMIDRARKCNSHVLESPVSSSSVSLRRRWMMSVASVAAVFLLCLGAYHWLTSAQRTYTTHNSIALEMDSLYHSKQVKVFLNGKQVVGLNKNNASIKVGEDGAVSVDDQLVADSRLGNISVNQIVVPYGKRSKLFLPDGSTLWINSGSLISYASNFSTNRILNVQGEVYLEVKKDVAHPFVVKTNRLEVTVLGTSFNVTDYASDSESAVVLVRGSVDVNIGNTVRKRLVPNQRLSNDHGKVNVDQVDVDKYICWKDDLMNCNGQKLNDILKSLARYYAVKIEVSGNLKEELYYGNLDLNRTIEDVLSTISLTTPLQIVKRNDVFYIKPKE